MRVEGRAGELGDCFRHIVSGSLDGNVIVFVKVDTSLLFGNIVWNTKEFSLETCVFRSRNVFPINPTTFAIVATGNGSAIATSIKVTSRARRRHVPVTLCRSSRSTPSIGDRTISTTIDKKL